MNLLNRDDPWSYLAQAQALDCIAKIPIKEEQAAARIRQRHALGTRRGRALWYKVAALTMPSRPLLVELLAVRMAGITRKKAACDMRRALRKPKPVGGWSTLGWLETLNAEEVSSESNSVAQDSLEEDR